MTSTSNIHHHSSVQTFGTSSHHDDFYGFTVWLPPHSISLVFLILLTTHHHRFRLSTPTGARNRALPVTDHASLGPGGIEDRRRKNRAAVSFKPSLANARRLITFLSSTSPPDKPQCTKNRNVDMRARAPVSHRERNPTLAVYVTVSSREREAQAKGPSSNPPPRPRVVFVELGRL